MPLGGQIMNWKLLVVPGVLLLAASAAAQTTSTEILGLVTDTSGAAVLGAEVTITRLATGQLQRHETNSAGEFFIPPGGDWRVHRACGKAGISGSKRPRVKDRDTKEGA